MKKTATILALLALASSTSPFSVKAQALRPSTESMATWDIAQGRWKDTVRTFEMSYTPEYTLVSRSPKYQTTYSGFAPVAGDVYQSRFFWDPQSTYSKVQIDSVHEDGTLTPVRLDQYDRTPGRTAYARSAWNAGNWTTIQTNVTMTDEMGIMRSSVNQAVVGGVFMVTDSLHVAVSQDLKGNVTNVKVWQWMIPGPELEPIVEQKYTLNGDGSIAIAEVWNNNSGEFAKAFRMHSFDWAVRNKSFPYISREPGVDLFYGGDGFRSMTVDLPYEDEWNEYYQVTQGFDEQGRATSYTFSAMARDTFEFSDGLISLAQHDDLVVDQWMTSQGTRTLYDRDANGTLRSVTSQRYDPALSQYVNDRLYYYTYGTADVTADNVPSITIYPNPVASELRIQSSQPVLGVAIVNVTGATVLRSANASVDVSSLVPGIYLATIRTQGATKVLRFIKSS